MIKGKAYLLGVHKDTFRAGEPAEILGVEIVIPDHGPGGSEPKPRACYAIQFDDTTIDSCPIEDNGAHKIISFEQILSGEYKKFMKD